MFSSASRSVRCRLTALAAGCTLIAALIAACSKTEPADEAGNGVALIIKTETNPFFVDIKQTALREADAKGLTLTTAAGTEDGDVGSQVAAIDAAITRGDRAIMITPNGAGVDNALRRARRAGVFVVALDTKPTDPGAADITFATDNFEAGRLIGAWAAEKMAGQTAVIALLDLFYNRRVESDYQRNQGFLTGMGIPVGDYRRTGDEAPTGVYRGGRYRIACQDVTLGAAAGGRAAMERCLSHSPDINLVYTINEPAASGAAEILDAADNPAVLVSVDGGCDPGLRLVSEGVIGATAQQNPVRMAEQAVDAVATFLSTGEEPVPDTGIDMIDTGVVLVTDDPQPGVPSIDVAEGMKRCWGKAA